VDFILQTIKTNGPAPLHYSPSGDCVTYWLFWNPRLHTAVFVGLYSCFEEQSPENTLAQISLQISWNLTLLYLILL